MDFQFSSKSSAPALLEGAASPEVAFWNKSIDCSWLYPQQPTRIVKEGGDVRRSTNHWDAALRFARACVKEFEEPVNNAEDIEKRANSALEWLTKR